MVKFVGMVVGTAMQKTAKVRVAHERLHPIVNKVVVKHKNFLAHDEDSKCAVGDQVLIESCQRVSKLKHFKVVDILKPAQRYTDEEGNEYSAIRGMTEREKERGYKDEVGWKLWQNRR